MEIDRAVPIILSEKEFEENAMALRSMRVLGTGITYLYDRIRGVESKFFSQLLSRDRDEKRCIIYGDSPAFEGIPIDLIECAFRWYAVSLCDFVRAVTSISDFDETTRNLYTQEVLGPVLAFRDKVGAHTAGFSRNKRDNDAERGITPGSQVVWDGDRFGVATFSMRINRGGKKSDSSSLQPWRLTERHDQLCVRFPILEQLRKSQIA